MGEPIGLQINITLAAGFTDYFQGCVLTPSLNEQFDLELKIIKCSKCSTRVINNAVYNTPIEHMKLHLSSINKTLFLSSLTSSDI